VPAGTAPGINLIMVATVAARCSVPSQRTATVAILHNKNGSMDWQDASMPLDFEVIP